MRKIIYLSLLIIVISVTYAIQEIEEVGCMSENCSNGQGSYYFFNGDKYIGEWKNGLMDGMGTFYYSYSGDKFVGNWKNGKKHGKGIIYYTSGEVKKGLWIEGELFFGTE